LGIEQIIPDQEQALILYKFSIFVQNNAAFRGLKIQKQPEYTFVAQRCVLSRSALP
jgi:hypothetical protein